MSRKSNQSGAEFRRQSITAGVAVVLVSEADWAGLYARDAERAANDERARRERAAHRGDTRREREAERAKQRADRFRAAVMAKREARAALLAADAAKREARAAKRERLAALNAAALRHEAALAPDFRPHGVPGTVLLGPVVLSSIPVAALEHDRRG